MDWIERLLHVSPDGGNGATEAGMAVAAIVAFVLGLRLRAARRRHRRAERAAPEGRRAKKRDGVRGSR